jgi:signal transduction histidine kinase
MLRAGFRSSFLIPIKVRNEGLGVMNFLGKQPHKFSEADQQLIKSIAYNLGITLGNANLFSQIKQKSVELESANKGKDEFLGIISHELRTPLNVIKGYTELIRSQVFGDINPEQDKALAKIVSQTKDLLSMINQVLQVTTIQAGAARVNCGHVNLCALLDELKSSYAIAVRKEVVVKWHYPRTLPVLNSDDEKLKAVIQNLINNALKFTDEGSISISAREILEERAIEIKVADTGMGIPKEQMETIFGMFQQVDSSTTRKHGGIGLGLYIVKTFTELLGGRVSMQSELGKGSVFSVTLPTGAAAGQIREVPSSAEA